MQKGEEPLGDAGILIRVVSCPRAGMNKTRTWDCTHSEPQLGARNSQLRPLFLYGTLRAPSLLAWALTGDPTKISQVSKLTRAAFVTGYARYTVSGKDYPAIIKHDATSCVDGLLLFPESRSQRIKLDDFEGETYRVTPVMVTITNDNGKKEQVDADVYVWNGDDAVSNDPWDLDTFVRERLDDWLELFVGMELVGHESDDST